MEDFFISFIFQERGFLLLCCYYDFPCKTRDLSMFVTWRNCSLSLVDFLYGLHLYLYVYFKTNYESDSQPTVIPLKLVEFDGHFSLILDLAKDSKNVKNIYSMNMGMVSTFIPLLITSIHICEGWCGTFYLVSTLFFQHFFSWNAYLFFVSNSWRLCPDSNSLSHHLLPCVWLLVELSVLPQSFFLLSCALDP